MERDANEADEVEQHQGVDDDPEPDEPSHDPEAPEADAIEQSIPVPVDDEEHEE